ncbi:MAG: LON peptidase substrate-binding domain-containing protein [Burkholderiales bacterium]
MLDNLPIFPLSSVLFPGGVLPLRIFEPRYMDMVRERMQRDAPFGICLITRGGEVGETADHEPVGCLAHIRGWDMEQLGVLQLRAVGGQRLRVLEREVSANGLIRAKVELLADDPQMPIPDEMNDCVVLIRRIVDDLRTREHDPERRMIAEPCDFESAAWVANRIAEFMPIPAPAKHKLMTLDEPVARLSIVHRWLHQHQVL